MEMSPTLAPVVQWAMGILLTLGSIFGVAKLAEIIITRMFVKNDQRQDINNVNYAKQLDDETLQRRELRGEIDDLRKEMRGMQKEINETVKASATMQAENTILKKDNERLTQELEKQGIANVQLKQETQRLQDQLGNTQKLLDATIQELNKMRTQMLTNGKEGTHAT